MSNHGYSPLTTETIAERLGNVDILQEKLGSDGSQWTSREVGDGNLNLVFIVDGPNGSVIVKQALPYVRLVGDSWPLPLSRSFFEYHALTRQAARDPGRVPEVYHFDEEQALIVMEYLSPHIILRQSLIEGKKTEGLGTALGNFCARTLFRGSDLHMETSRKKADVALFADNVALCDITENLVFTDPYFEAEMNRHTSPWLDDLVAELRADTEMKLIVQEMKTAFCNRAETMLHGDLHTGSIMVTDSDTKVIDPEFALYGPMGFDMGMLTSNMLMAWFAQPGHEASPGSRTSFQDWIANATSEIWQVFTDEFTRLWETERTGILYPSAVLEDQGHTAASRKALEQWLNTVWQDSLKICGIEIHRRILGLAHNADFETITDEERRATLEAQALRFGRELILNGNDRCATVADIFDVAGSFVLEDA
ncbi:S-methyl-5-thioribose kinase [Amaricoccus tamworthensis]|uniref:S-methyl-5-thioribose kinase n=1 Tax=Amaricoccus tamworthensis TaxID=57002 RepID=UPI003C7AC5C2